jgi:hypothetical protein
MFRVRMRWLNVVLILYVSGFANSSLSVVSCRHFDENGYLGELLKTCIVNMCVCVSPLLDSLVGL